MCQGLRVSGSPESERRSELWSVYASFSCRLRLSVDGWSLGWSCACHLAARRVIQRGRQPAPPTFKFIHSVSELSLTQHLPRHLILHLHLFSSPQGSSTDPRNATVEPTAPIKSNANPKYVPAFSSISLPFCATLPAVSSSRD